MSFEEGSSGPDNDMLQDFMLASAKTILFIGLCLKYYAMLIPIFSVFSVIQEYKIWKKTSTPLNAWGILKVYIFNILWMLFCFLGAILLFPLWLQRGFGPSVEIESNVVMEKLIAIGVHSGLVGPVKIVNEDKLPDIHLTDPTAPAPVFVANHGSQLDVSAVYFCIRRFKWIAKKSVRYIPGPGNLMTLGGHIFIQRTGKNSNSVSNLYQQSNEAIQAGIPMMLFPQGTRRRHEKIPFKDGAFKIAIENECEIVPLSISIKSNVWNSWYPLNLLWGGGEKEGNTKNSDGNNTTADNAEVEAENQVTITVHDPISVTKDMDRAELKLKCQDAIYSALPPVHEEGSNKGKDANDKKKD